ncbi:MAG: FAD/NAD(P)-binding protein [Firmicutes bacterium]|nr:FAD/NAD(P)-binding protein [Bacillota bacterium]
MQQSSALKKSPLIPEVATIEKITQETPDVKTFRVVFDDPSVMDGFTYRSGQCAMVSLPGVGEAMISITASPTRKGFLEFSVKKAGMLTGALHEAEEGQKIGVRGPYGNSFPIESMYGKDLVFIGGGIGLAPLRSLINNVLDNRDKFGAVEIIYGARSPQDLVFKEEILENWSKVKGVKVHVTVDKGDDDWKGPVGFVPAFAEQVNPSPAGSIAITCGPPIMIKFVLQTLAKLKFTPEQIITTLEMKMKCGVGKCGRCNIGEKYVCVDGPVFTLAQLGNMPNEF